MKLAVVGSRSFSDFQILSGFLDKIAPRVSAIVTGDAKGADRLAARWARERGIPTIVFRADWARHGRAAGPIRNQEIVDAADAMVAFWDGTSRGTKDAIQRARKKGIPVEIVGFVRVDGDFLVDTEEARRLRRERLEPLLATSERVVVDFAGARVATNAWTNALLGSILARQRRGLLDKITFTNCSPAVRAAIRLTVEAALRTVESQEPKGGHPAPTPDNRGRETAE